MLLGIISLSVIEIEIEINSLLCVSVCCFSLSMWMSPLIQIFGGL